MSSSVTFNPPVMITIDSAGRTVVTGTTVGQPSTPPVVQPPPVTPPPSPVAGLTPRQAFYLPKIKSMISAGGRTRCLAPLQMQKEGGMQSKLEPYLRPMFASAQEYARFLDPYSFGAPYNYGPFPSEAETAALNAFMIEGRNYPNA